MEDEAARGGMFKFGELAGMGDVSSRFLRVLALVVSGNDRVAFPRVFVFVLFLFALHCEVPKLGLSSFPLNVVIIVVFVFCFAVCVFFGLSLRQ